MTNEKLIKAAYDLVILLDKGADTLLPREIVKIVKLHSKLAVGSAWIPLPGVDLAASAASIWGMYIRINSKIGIPFGENVMKSIGSGVATNLAGYIAVSGLASAMKFIPGIGSVGGALIMSGSAYAVTLASGYIYLEALCMLAKRKGKSITSQDLKDAVDKVLKEKNSIQNFIEEAKKEYKDK